MKEKIAYDYDYFSVSIIWGRSVRLTETLVIMLPSIGVLLQKQVSPKMFNHAAINVSQLKTNLVCKGASESLTCYLWPSLSCKKKKKDLASVCWNKWWTFTFTGAKEQLWLQVWLHFIKQFPMHCFFFSCINMYCNISMPLWCHQKYFQWNWCVHTFICATGVCMTVHSIFSPNTSPNYKRVLHVFTTWLCICQWEIVLDF